MEITNQLSLALLTVFGLVGAGLALSTRHRDVALWFGFAATVMGALSFFAWLQGHLWKQDADAEKALAAPAARPRIFFVEPRLILPTAETEPLRITFGLINRGDADGTVTLKDSTYYFSTDPTQKTFKYRPSPPQEMPVTAIPNAVWRAELRYDFHLSPEKVDAISAGRARLFFFARTEYRDDAGTTYPLSFAQMYDAHFPGNLISCPSDVEFE